MFEQIPIQNKDGPAIDFEALKEKTFIDLTQKVDRPQTIISIGEHPYKDNHYPTSVMTAGEFSCIVAPSKTKKSFIKSAIAGAFIGGNSKLHFPDIKGHRKDDTEEIVDFDTEQSRYYSQRTFNRATEISGNQYVNYKPYMLRTLSPRERLLFIEHILYSSTNVKLVFIDGAADLIDDTNDLAQSNELASYFLKWTEELGMHLCVIIHSAYGTDKATGHLGSTLIKKAESVILLKPTDDSKKIIRAVHQYSRGYSFEDFYFSIKNNDALPYQVDSLTHEFPVAEGDTLKNEKYSSEPLKNVSVDEAFLSQSLGTEDEQSDVPF